jgi:hypothetical protein
MAFLLFLLIYVLNSSIIKYILLNQKEGFYVERKEKSNNIQL